MNQLHARTGLVCTIIGQHKTKKKIECLRNLVSVLSWHSLTYHFVIYFDFHFVLLTKREREGEREGDIDR